MEGHALPKAVIDAIMEENGRDIENAKKPPADYETLRQSAEDWKNRYEQAEKTHQKELSRLRFEGLLTQAVTAAGGRNQKAIAALLDTEAIQASDDPKTALEQAVSDLKQECGYLFSDPQTPPPYARGTGIPSGEEPPATLAGILKQKMERK